MHVTPIALLMERRADMRADMTALLQQRFQVIAASAPAEAVAHLQTRHPDMILWSLYANGDEGPAREAHMRFLVSALAIASRTGARFILLTDDSDRDTPPGLGHSVTVLEHPVSLGDLE